MQSQVFITMALNAWNSHNRQVNDLVETLSDEQWMKETSPGRNRGIYLLGHLIAVSDGMLPLLGAGEKLYPELTEIFLQHPDNHDQSYPSLDALKNYWKEVNARLSQFIVSISLEEWFTRHTAVTEDVFKKEPHRNKLNIIINRTNHTSYHLGQLVYLKENIR